MAESVDLLVEAATSAALLLALGPLYRWAALPLLGRGGQGAAAAGLVFALPAALATLLPATALPALHPAADLALLLAAAFGGPWAGLAAAGLALAARLAAGAPAWIAPAAVLTPLLAGLWLCLRRWRGGRPFDAAAAALATGGFALAWQALATGGPAPALLLPAILLLYAGLGAGMVRLLDAERGRIPAAASEPPSPGAAEAALAALETGIVAVDAGGRLAVVNPAFAALLGLKPEAMRPGEPWAALAERLALPAEGEIRRDGRLLLLRRRALAGGGFVAALADETAAQAGRARLAAAAQRNASLAAAIAAASNGVVVTDPNLPGNPIVFVNEAFTRITGYAASEAIGRNCRLLQGRDTDAETVARMRRAIAQRKPLTVTVRNYRKDGRTFWNELSLGPVYDERGQLVHFVGILADATSRVRAEEALRRSEQELRELAETHAATLDSLPACVALLDMRGRVVSVNRRWRELEPGEGPDAIRVGEDYPALLETREAGAAAGLRAVLAGEREQFACEYAFGPGGAGEAARWFRFVATPTSKRERRGAVVMHLDISERIAAEQALRAAKEQAELANRSKSEFLANVSHELRTPLNAIIGFSEIMQGEMFGPLGGAQYREYAQDIHESGRHLLSIINDILDLSKIEAGKFVLHETEVALAEALQSCLRLVRDRAAASRLALRTELAPDADAVFADERAIKQILINLLSNAVKFTPAGGNILVRAARDANGDLLLSVVDTGIGIAEKDIAKAMAAFSQVESPLTRKYAGTGLGLPLVRLLAELHGGSMAITSRPGEGTTVAVRIPERRRVLAT